MVDPSLVELFDQAVALAQAKQPGRARERYLSVLALHAREALAAEPRFLAATKLLLAYTSIDLGDLPTALSELAQVDPAALDPSRFYDLHFTRGNVLGGLRQLVPMFAAFVAAISAAEDLDDYDERPRACWSKILGITLAARDWPYLREVAAKAQQVAGVRGWPEITTQAAVCLAEAATNLARPVVVTAPDAEGEVLVLDGGAAGHTLKFSATIRLGSGRDCDLMLPGCTAHATISPDGATYRLRATGDVFLDGVAVTDVSLASISKLVIGGVSLIAQKRCGAYISTPTIHSAPTPAPAFAPPTAVHELGPLITARAGAGLALLDHDRVLIAGGASPQRGAAFATAELFTLTTSTSRSVPLVAARTGPAVARLADGRILLAGGGTHTAEIFDPHTEISLATASMQTVRTGAHALVLPNGLVVALGGLYKPDALAAEVYDPAKGAWGGLRSPSFTVAHAAPLDATRFLIAATSGSTTPRPPASFYIFDSRTWRFEAISPPAAPRWSPRLCALGAGRVLILCGSPTQHARTVELYDAATNAFSRMPDMLSHRATPAITRVRSGRVLVVGGGSLSEGVYSAEMFDPEACQWSALPAIWNGLNPVGGLAHADGSAIVVSFGAVSRAHDSIRRGESV